jgi:hypothetical protein
MERKQQIAERWLERVLSTYPAETAVFLVTEKDPFRNPVGHTMRRALATLAEEVTGTMNQTRVIKALDAIMQIRAVQDTSASTAIEFLFHVKPALADFDAGLSPDQIDGRIDEMVLLAIDSYMKYRERVFSAKANEARRRVFVLERRFGMHGEPPAEEPCTR